MLIYPEGILARFTNTHADQADSALYRLHLLPYLLPETMTRHSKNQV